MHSTTEANIPGSDQWQGMTARKVGAAGRGALAIETIAATMQATTGRETLIVLGPGYSGRLCQEKSMG